MPPSAPHLTLVNLAGIPCSKPDTEKELKLITPDGSSEPFDLFTQDLESGLVEGIEILQSSSPQRLIARQLDTPDQALRKMGISLRIRATYENGQIRTPDINIKTKKADGELGMSRGEYEENISDAGIIDLSVIEKKYAAKIAAGLLPDLQQALAVIKTHLKGDELIEHFLIDTERTRRVVGLDSGIVGFENHQKFIGEMLSDKVRYQVRSPSTLQTIQMTVNKGRRELELEPLHIPCEFNKYAGCEDHVCKGLDSLDEDLSLLFFREAVQRYADRSGRPIEDAKLSKSGRGFEGWEQLSRVFNAIAGERAGISATLLTHSTPAELSDTYRTVLVKNINVPWALKAA